jgi:hypothetical protein
MNRLAFLLVLLISLTYRAHSQDIAWYNTDSLLTDFSKNEKIAQILINAGAIYSHAGIDTANISLTAFKVAYLEKQMIDKRAIHIRHRHRYKNKKIISIVDYTKKSNAMRFATIDLSNKKMLFDTLVSQGSGKGDKKNDKYHTPVFFSNTENSETSSLGMIVTKKARQPENPCHFCKYTLTVKHKCTIILLGMEKGINDNVKRRDIVMHTTGSADLGSSAKNELGIDDLNYRMATNECKCYHTGDDGRIKGVAAYASACGLTENNGYIGQSNGCLVLPEDHHIEIMNTIKKKSLVFIYSNVIFDSTNYFKDSPVIRKIIKYAGK